MMKKIKEIMNTNFDFLPLKSYVNIVEVNALALIGKALLFFGSLFLIRSAY